ncbi:hypothetical protein [Halomonas sp. MM17-34]|uniref:hypothetical protein n=1 Tax=Halomonas sp. MM17-34 TaxID=2917742 RepID=UPI001EF48E60|nr:hypothetical protein [Halomonas sp. MM17-34]MCG7605685.1 hypothetical protein [Halomonas sp. MM17-34]
MADGTPQTSVEICKRLEALTDEQTSLLAAYPEALRQEALKAQAMIIEGWQQVEKGVALWEKCQQQAAEESLQANSGGPFSSHTLSGVKRKMAAIGTSSSAFRPELMAVTGLTIWLDDPE